MNINDKMNYSEKISEFIDGELSQEESSELFSTLAQNPNLQDELRQSLVLKNMFHQELMPPPSISKTHLYAKLNLQKSAVILSFLLTTLINLRRIFFTPAFSSALIGVALFTASFFMSNNSNNGTFNNANSNKNGITKEKNNIVASALPIISSSEGQQISSKQKFSWNSGVSVTKKNKSVINRSENTFAKNENDNSVSQPNNSLAINPPNKNSENIEADKNSQSFVFLPIETSNINSRFSGSLSNGFKSNFFSSIAYELTSILENISLTLNKSYSVSTTNTNLEPLSNPLLNNYSISIIYSFDKHNALAAELGQENFQQKYNGQINGFDADIAQVYTAQWYGISYQYSFGEIDNLYGLNPFIKALVSGTSIGPYFKGSVGLSFPINEKISLVGAIEASKLTYNFQNQWFYTDKYGVIYGVRIGF